MLHEPRPSGWFLSFLQIFELIFILCSGKTDTRIWGYSTIENYSTTIYQPVETALAKGDYIIIPALLEAGAEVNNMTFTSLKSYKYTSNKKTILDWVVDGLEYLENSIKSTKDEHKKDKTVDVYTPLEKANSWKEYFDDFCKRHSSSRILPTQEDDERKRKDKIQQLESLERTREYLQHIHSTLKLFGAKTWQEAYGEPKPMTDPVNNPPVSPAAPKITNINEPPKPRYKFLSKYYRHGWVQHDLSERYDALFEAAFRGDDAKIEKLCVPSEEETDASVVPVQITVEEILLDGGLVLICDRTLLTVYQVSRLMWFITVTVRDPVSSHLFYSSNCCQLFLCRSDSVARGYRRQAMEHCKTHHGNCRGSISRR